MCYVAIVFLFLLIAIPPIVRTLYQDEKEVVIDKYTMITCTKENYTISESYKNGEALSIKFNRLLVDPNLEISTEKYRLEFDLDMALKQIVNANPSDEELINYLVEFRNLSSEELLKFADYRFPLDSQLTHYQGYGYNCNIIEQ